MKLTLLVLTLLCSVAAADDLAEAERLYNEGQRAFDASQYGDALTAWQRSYALSNAPGLLYNLAQAYRLRGAVGDCAAAVDHYQRFIALDPTSAQRELAERFQAEAAACARQSSTLPTPVTASASTQRPIAPAIVTRPVSRSSYRRLALGLGIGGVALTGLGLYYGYRADVLGDDVTNACATSCNWAVYGPKEAVGRSAETRQYVFVGVGVAAMLSGGALYWWSSREPSRLSVVPRADGAAVTWSRTW